MYCSLGQTFVSALDSVLIMCPQTLLLVLCVSHVSQNLILCQSYAPQTHTWLYYRSVMWLGIRFCVLIRCSVFDQMSTKLKKEKTGLPT